MLGKTRYQRLAVTQYRLAGQEALVVRIFRVTGNDIAHKIETIFFRLSS